MESAKQDDPHVPPEYFVVLKEEAATRQLETAITLWFNYGDPVSIHTLASAANEIFHRMSARKGQPSVLEAWLKTQPKVVRDQARKSQNFFKHASTDPDGKIPYFPQEGEMKILDAMLCYKHLRNGYLTPLMCAFEMFWYMRNPNAIPTQLQDTFRDAPKGEMTTNRTKFLNAVMPVYLEGDAEMLAHCNGLHVKSDA
jgi:hypothetical protein